MSTSHIRRIPALPERSKNLTAGSVRRKKLKVDGCLVVQLDQLLWKSECEWLVQQSEALGLVSVAHEYDERYRAGDRVLVRSEELAQRVWKTLLEGARVEDLDGVKPYGHGTEGGWVPKGVNPLWRVMRYGVGGKFNRHRDGGFVYSANERSAMTLLVFLNEKFGGGETELGDTSHSVRVTPRTGRALLFNHDALHAGLPVESGYKYVLRTDIMYIRVDPRDSGFATDPDFQRSMKLYDQSIALQKKGHARKSTKCFLEAMEIQANAFASLRDHCEPSFLSFDSWRSIIRYLGLLDHVRLACVSHSFKRVARDSSAWRARYIEHFDRMVQLRASEIGGWYELFRFRYLAEIFFDVFSVDLSSNLLVASLLSHRGFTRCPAILGQVSGHYWSSHSAFRDVMMGHDILENSRSEYGYELLGRRVLLPSLSEMGSGLVDMPLNGPEMARPSNFNSTCACLLTSFLQEPFLKHTGRMRVQYRAHPLLVAVPPFVSPEERNMLAAQFSKEYSGLSYILIDTSDTFVSPSLGIHHIITVSDSFICYSQVVDGVSQFAQYRLFSQHCYGADIFEFKENTELTLSMLQEDESFFSWISKNASEIILSGVMSESVVVQQYFRDKLPDTINITVIGGQVAVATGMRAFCSRPDARDQFRSCVDAANLVAKYDLQLEGVPELFERLISWQSYVHLADWWPEAHGVFIEKIPSHIGTTLPYVLEGIDTLTSVPACDSMTMESIVMVALLRVSARVTASSPQVVILTMNSNAELFLLLHQVSTKAPFQISLMSSQYAASRSKDTDPKGAQLICGDIGNELTSSISLEHCKLIIVLYNIGRFHWNREALVAVLHKKLKQASHQTQLWFVEPFFSHEESESCRSCMRSNRPRVLQVPGKDKPKSRVFY